jgi:hypothetical protein
MSFITRFSVFKNIRTTPNQFNYRPRYYNPDKEDLQTRKRRIEHELNIETSDEDYQYKPTRIKFARSKGKVKTVRSGIKSSNIRLLVILAMLTLGVVYVLNWLDGMTVN